MNFEGMNKSELNKIRINPNRFTVTVHDQLLSQTKIEYELLLFLLASKNRVLTQEAIATHIWGDNYELVDSSDFDKFDIESKIFTGKFMIGINHD